MFKSGKYAELAEDLDLNEKNLGALLPDKEKPQADKYRRLISFTRDFRICQDDNGTCFRSPNFLFLLDYRVARHVLRGICA